MLWRRITLPDDAMVSSDEAEVDQVLSRAFGRDVTLRAVQQLRDQGLASTHLDPWGDCGTLRAEMYWPDLEGLGHPDTVTDFDLSDETFFDSAVVHLLTTATIVRRRTCHQTPASCVRRASTTGSTSGCTPLS